MRRVVPLRTRKLLVYTGAPNTCRVTHKEEGGGTEAAAKGWREFEKEVGLSLPSTCTVVCSHRSESGVRVYSQIRPGHKLKYYFFYL